jgi:hypothetical protein
MKIKIKTYLIALFFLIFSVSLWGYAQNASAQNLSADLVQVSSVKIKGVDYVGVMKNQFGDHNFYLYSVEGGFNAYQLIGGDKWEVPSGNNVVAFSGVDVDGDGTDEIGVVKDEGGDFNFYLYLLPDGMNPASKAGSDLWNIPDGNNVVDISGIDVNGDGKDELAVLKRDGEDYNVYFYSVSFGDNQQNILFYDLWNIPDGNNLVSMEALDADGDGKEELGVIKGFWGNDQDFYVYKIDWEVKGMDLVGADKWNIPSGNKVIDSGGVDFDKNGRDEVIVVKDDEGDLNMYLYSVPLGIYGADLLGGDLWNVPGDVGYGSGDMEIRVVLGRQRLEVFQGGRLIREMKVSTGVPGMATPVGSYQVQQKIPVKLYSGPGYYLPNTRYNMQFRPGYYLHEAYWHNNFGRPMSHGCINLRADDARWLYEWSRVGTRVSVVN